ncbi:MAG TPA: polyamine aminopropyltransferase [Firmicutes bacterium]|mgnify:CR=1 FL=1|jgi:spermidine synthase|nr:polyamine aminopropyltransferase [Bacillota bacterium]
MELWYTEKQTPNAGLTCTVKKTLLRCQTKYQELAVVDTFQFGRMLVLDGMVQTTAMDEFVYHEMIVHVPMFTHPSPRNVVVIGGGDGGTVREICKYPSVERVVLVEIDAQVVEAARRFLPELSYCLDDPRVEIHYTDGIEYIHSLDEFCDLIIVDSTEPVGPAIGLFDAPFYRAVFKALKKDGILVAQTESPFYNAELIRSVFPRIKGAFPAAYLYLASVPTYPSGLWSFTMGSKRYDPLSPQGTFSPGNTRYYRPEVHRASFVLPRFVQELIE